jgi:hypothetical protein
MNAPELEIPTDSNFVWDTVRVYRDGVQKFSDGRQFTRRSRAAPIFSAQAQTRSGHYTAAKRSSLKAGPKSLTISIALFVSRFRPLSRAEEHARRLELLPSALSPKPNCVYFLYGLIDRLTIPCPDRAERLEREHLPCANLSPRTRGDSSHMGGATSADGVGA